MANAPRQPAADLDIVELSGSTTLDDLCRSCSVEHTWVAELVAHGVITPTTASGGAHQHFSGSALLRVRKAKRLVGDFDLNTAGVALALDLIDEIERLRARLTAFERARLAHDDD